MNYMYERLKQQTPASATVWLVNVDSHTEELATGKK